MVVARSAFMSHSALPSPLHNSRNPSLIPVNRRTVQVVSRAVEIARHLTTGEANQTDSAAGVAARKSWTEDAEERERTDVLGAIHVADELIPGAAETDAGVDVSTVQHDTAGHDAVANAPTPPLERTVVA